MYTKNNTPISVHYTAVQANSMLIVFDFVVKEDISHSLVRYLMMIMKPMKYNLDITMKTIASLYRLRESQFNANLPVSLTKHLRLM